MKKKHIELKAILGTHRAELMRSVQAGERKLREEPTDVVDGDDFAAMDNIEPALLQLQSDMLTKTDEALERLEQGTYGECNECGEEIATARLRALPFAARCKECQEDFERELERDQHTLNFETR